MHQFEFAIASKTSAHATEVRVTAAREEIARAQCQLAFKGYVVGELVATRNPHEVLGEVDCSYFPESDTAWLLAKASSL